MSHKIRNDRTQRAMARSRASVAMRRREAWLASLDPEHRAIHDRPLGAMCSRCLNESARRAGEGIAAAFAAIRLPR